MKENKTSESFDKLVIDIVCYVFVGTSFVASIYFYLKGSHSIAYSQLLTSFLLSFIFYLNHYRNSIALAKHALMIISLVLAFPLFWIQHNGSRGPALLILTVMLIITSMIWKKKHAYLYSFLQISEAIGLFFIEQFFSEKIPFFSGNTYSSNDAFIEKIIITTAISYVMIQLLHDYNRDKELLFLKTRELEKLNKHLMHISTVDALTGLANRRLFEEYFIDELCRAKRNNTTVSMLMMDVDNFKKFNDTYGHIEGDRILTAVGDMLGSTVKRSADLAARYGGEEFAIIMPATSIDHAVQLAKKIMATRDNTAELNSPVRVTFSIGIAENPPGNCNVEKIVELADQALYKAKDNGKNCFVSSLV